MKLINLTHLWQNIIRDINNFHLAILIISVDKENPLDIWLSAIVIIYKICLRCKVYFFFQCCFSVWYFESVKNNKQIKVAWIINEQNASILIHTDNVNLLNKNVNTLQKNKVILLTLWIPCIYFSAWCSC